MTVDNKNLDVEDFLAHYGVKGMKWGIRKTDESGQARSWTHEEKVAAAKKVAIGASVLTLAVGAAYLAKNSDLMKTPISSIDPSTINATAVAATKKAAEQTDVLLASRGHSKGFHFIKNGGLPSPLADYENAFGQNKGGVSFKKLDDGRIASGFLDPEGRADFAGRPITHQVLIPKTLAVNIDSNDDVVTQIWPQIQADYGAMYDNSYPKY